MPATDLKGIWTYRSFRKTEEAVGEFNKLTVWEAELSIDADDDSSAFVGHLGERPAIASANEACLHVTGVYFEGVPSTVRWRAVGKKCSEFDGWIYDYSGILSATWPDGTSGNVPTITGTVTRTVKHGAMPSTRATWFKMGNE